MTVLRWWAATAVATALAASASVAQAECKFQKIAEVPVTMEGLKASIGALINGKDAKFIIDTGAVFGAVTPDAVTKFAMKRSVAPFGMQAVGIGGTARDISAVSADTFTFAGIGFHDTQFMVIPRLGGDGIIGENLMGPFDVEYDFANGALRYFKPEGCGYDTNLAYWSKGLAVSRVSLIDPTRLITRIIASAKVDGHTIKVVFDSGASLSMMSRAAAGRAGIQVTSEGVANAGVTYGVYGKGLESFLAPFASFAIGDEEIKNTRLRVVESSLGDADMILGADFFLSHRILVSNSQKKIYFTYNGGPVFRLDQTPRPAQVAAATTPSASPSGAVATATAPATVIAGEEPKTGSEFARRAAAFAARREFQPAIADYSRAIELEPDNAKHYRARAMVRLAARQPVLAMADLDESLKREPNDPEALMRRGDLYLISRDPGRAKADFDTAMKLDPGNSNLAAQAGQAYARSGFYEEAIRHLDTWIAAHPKDEDLPGVLAARCFARAAWGKQLDIALADCDLAMRKDRTSQTMQTRGLVLLRMGKLDEAVAQFTATIKAQPRDAQALYGRGLAELKKGDKAAGDADIAAAAAIAPQIAAQFKRLGLEPDGASPAKS